MRSWYYVWLISGMFFAKKGLKKWWPFEWPVTMKVTMRATVSIISLLETSSEIIISLLVLPDTFLRVVIWFWQDCSILLFYILLRLWRNILMFLLCRALIVLFEGCLQKSCNIVVSFDLIHLIWFRILLFCLYIWKLIMFLMCLGWSGWWSGWPALRAFRGQSSWTALSSPASTLFSLLDCVNV